MNLRWEVVTRNTKNNSGSNIYSQAYNTKNTSKLQNPRDKSEETNPNYSSSSAQKLSIFFTEVMFHSLQLWSNANQKDTNKMQRRTWKM